MKLKKILSFALTLIFANYYSSTPAMAPANVAEMVSALATIPFDRAAQHFSLEKDEKSAAIFHMITDVIRLVNKSWFLYNNVQLQQAHGGWQLGRDNVVNGTLAGLDIVKLYQHINAYKTARQTVPQDSTDVATQDVYVVPTSDQTDTEQSDITQPSALAYTWRITLLPTLQGLTAFAIALTQVHGSRFATPCTRNLATAAHSLTRLLEEHNALDVDSSYKKPLAGLLVANTLWLIKEIKNYIEEEIPEEEEEEYTIQDAETFLQLLDEQPHNHINPPIPLQNGGNGDCLVCMENGALQQLSCGHSYCMGCLSQHVTTQLNGRNAHIRCLNPGCNHISEGQIRTIIEQNHLNLNRYNRLLRQNVPGTRECPSPNCDHTFVNPNHRAFRYRCPDCDTLYCANCGVRHHRNLPCIYARMNNLDLDMRNRILHNENETLCPNCFVHIERIAACQHMTCAQPNCRYEFCLYCHERHPNHRFGCNFRYFDAVGGRRIPTWRQNYRLPR